MPLAAEGKSRRNPPKPGFKIRRVHARLLTSDMTLEPIIKGQRYKKIFIVK